MKQAIERMDYHHNNVMKKTVFFTAFFISIKQNTTFAPYIGVLGNNLFLAALEVEICRRTTYKE
jgi:hypothetical protein